MPCPYVLGELLNGGVDSAGPRRRFLPTRSVRSAGAASGGEVGDAEEAGEEIGGGVMMGDGVGGEAGELGRGDGEVRRLARMEGADETGVFANTGELI